MLNTTLKYYNFGQRVFRDMPNQTVSTRIKNYLF